MKPNSINGAWDFDWPHRRFHYYHEPTNEGEPSKPICSITPEMADELVEFLKKKGWIQSLIDINARDQDLRILHRTMDQMDSLIKIIGGSASG